jgi:hypothetical protein
LQPLIPLIALLAAYAATAVYAVFAQKGVLAGNLAVALLLTTVTLPAYTTLAKGGWWTRGNFHDEEIPFVQIANYIDCNSSKNDNFFVYQLTASSSAGFIIQNVSERWSFPHLIGTSSHVRKDLLNGYWYNDYNDMLRSNPKFIVVIAKDESDMTQYINGNYVKIIDGKAAQLFEFKGRANGS